MILTAKIKITNHVLEKQILNMKKNFGTVHIAFRSRFNMISRIWTFATCRYSLYCSGYLYPHGTLYVLTSAASPPLLFPFSFLMKNCAVQLCMYSVQLHESSTVWDPCAALARTARRLVYCCVLVARASKS